MSNSTSLLDILAESQANKEEKADALFDACSQAALFGRRDSTSSGTTWGYYGGRLLVRGVPTAIANGTVVLTVSTINYVEANGAGVVSVNTSAFSADKYPLYEISCSSLGASTWTDHRPIDFDPASLVVAASTGSSYAVDLRLAQTFSLTLNAATVTLSFTNPPTSPNRPWRFRLILTQDGTGGRIVTWPASVLWPPLASSPSLATAAGAVEIVDLMTIDGGTTYFGQHVASY